MKRCLIKHFVVESLKVKVSIIKKQQEEFDKKIKLINKLMGLKLSNVMK